MKQVLFWIPEYDKEYGHQVVPWPYPSEPTRVWTVIGPDKPDLPVVPRHNQNVFLEDRWHDWCITDGMFHYMSRVASGGVWLLCEFKTE